MKDELREVPLDLIDPNPYRNLATYPWIEKKIAHLAQSINDVGLWSAIYAREAAGRYQNAFGHHRIETARRLKLKNVPLIVRQLSDREMLLFMAKENGEEYGNDFLVSLNTWEGAMRYHQSIDCKMPQALDIAKILHWTHHSRGRLEMSPAAAACHAAHALIEHGHLKRETLRNLSTGAGRELCVATAASIASVNKLGKQGAAPGFMKEAQKIIAKSAAIVADKVRKQEVHQKHIRTEVRVASLEQGHHKPQVLPLFAAFGKAVIKKVDNMLSDDRAALHITQIERVLDKITLEEDHAVVRDLHHSLDQLGYRAAASKRRTTLNKVVSFKAVGKE